MKKLCLSFILLLSCSFACIDEGVEKRAFPGAAIVVIQDNKVSYARAYGTLTYEDDTPVTLDTLFDLASLTKPLVTTLSVLKLYEEGRLSLGDPLAYYFPNAAPEICLRHLLCHESGLPADIPAWLKEADFVSLTQEAKAQRIWNYILDEAQRAKPVEKSLYSDLGFILLGKVVEQVSGQTLDAYFNTNFAQPLGMTRTLFCPLKQGFSLSQIAPTEIDHYWRHRLIHGTVHDEKAEILGGVAGHAGLFSTANDLTKIMQMITQGGTLDGRRYLNSATVELFSRAMSQDKRFALSWSKELPAEGFSPAAFGHTGFTGTAIYVDPERKLCVIFLSNRVYPTRDNIQIRRVRKELLEALP